MTVLPKKKMKTKMTAISSSTLARDVKAVKKPNRSPNNSKRKKKTSIRRENSPLNLQYGNLYGILLWLLFYRMRHFRDVVWVLDGICLHHMVQRWEAVAMMDEGMYCRFDGRGRGICHEGV